MWAGKLLAVPKPTQLDAKTVGVSLYLEMTPISQKVSVFLPERPKKESGASCAVFKVVYCYLSNKFFPWPAEIRSAGQFGVHCPPLGRCCLFTPKNHVYIIYHYSPIPITHVTGSSSTLNQSKSATITQKMEDLKKKKEGQNTPKFLHLGPRTLI